MSKLEIPFTLPSSNQHSYFFRVLGKTKLVRNYSLSKSVNPVLNLVWVSEYELFCPVNSQKVCS